MCSSDLTTHFHSTYYYLKDCFFVHKRELFFIPIFGQYLFKSNMVAINRYLFHSEAYEDGYVVFGTEQLVIDEANDLVGGDGDGSFNTSPYVSFTPDGLGAVGLVGLFTGADTDVSDISNYHTGIFKLSDDHGASWYGCGDDPENGCARGASGAEYAFIPDSVFDDLVATQFNYTVEDECEGTTHLLDDFNLREEVSMSMYLQLAI